MATQSPRPEAGADSGRSSAAPPARDPGVRVLRWAAAATLIGAFLVYHAVDSSGSDLAIGAPTPDPGLSVPAAPMATPVTTDPGESAAPATPSPTRTPGLSLPASAPTRLVIRSIGVNAPFTPLSMDAAGVLQPPPDTDNNLAGWYKAGVTPGQLGNAIVAGHVDTRTGPAVFFLLPFLHKGDPLDITRADGVVATFKVDSVHTFSKGAFPDQLVYGDTPDAQLRLITCAGEYNRATHDYSDNVVVFAHLSATRPA